MRLIVLSLGIILSVFCSCRSSKQTVMDYADTASVVINEAHDSVAREEVGSVISISRDLDLSGIKVEFFPPDSASARPVPKSITIESAKAKASERQLSVEQTTVAELKAVTLRADTASELKQESTSDVNALSPPGYLLFFSILISIVLISTFVYLKFFRKS